MTALVGGLVLAIIITMGVERIGPLSNIRGTSSLLKQYFFLKRLGKKKKKFFFSIYLFIYLFVVVFFGLKWNLVKQETVGGQTCIQDFPPSKKMYSCIYKEQRGCVSAWRLTGQQRARTLPLFSLYNQMLYMSTCVYTHTQRDLSNTILEERTKGGRSPLPRDIN